MSRLKGALRTSELVVPPPLTEIPIGILEPVKINDIQTQLSTVISVAMECGLGMRPPESIAHEEIQALEKM